MPLNVLLLDDDTRINGVVSSFIRKNGFNVIPFTSPGEFMAQMNDIPYDIAILDVNLGATTGFNIMKLIKQTRPRLPCIIITAFGNMDEAIMAVRQGAYDYILKPFRETELINRLKNAVKYMRLESDSVPVNREIFIRNISGQLIGESGYIRKLTETIMNVAENDVNIFLTGPTGTGKEVVARALHNFSKRASGPFIPINCASIPDNLLESELFGYVKGAFSGAVSDRKGKFEMAHKGTVFLDEITEMPLHLQSKLLRVIQEKEFEPLGSDKTTKIDVRFVSASNINVEEAVKKGLFRQDLYYRLNIYPIKLIPLQEHKEDIPLLVRNFLAKKNLPAITVIKNCLKRLMEYNWPGNVRELESVLLYALVNAQGKSIALEHLPERIISFSSSAQGSGMDRRKTLNDSEREIIINALKTNKGNQTKTAGQLGITRAVLLYKIKKLGISRSSDYN